MKMDKRHLPSLETLIKLILLTMGIVLTIFMMGMRLYKDYGKSAAAAYREIERFAAAAQERSFTSEEAFAAFASSQLFYWKPLSGETPLRENSKSHRTAHSANGYKLTVRLDSEGIWDGLLEENRMQLVLAFLTLIVSVQIASLLAYSVTSPLRRIAWGFKQLSAGKSARIPRSTFAANELSLLTDAFNEMAATIDKWREVQSRIVRMDRLASLGEMVSGVAHEIRNPLASMRIHLDLLQNGLQDDEKNMKRLAVFEEELGRLERKLNRFLDFARHRSNRREEIDPAELARWVIAMVETSARAHGVMVQLQLAATEPIGHKKFYGDPDELRQAMLNLALNGVQAMEDSGELKISVDYADDRVRFCVADTGGGIPESIRSRLFEPFVTSRSGGTGLGLSITRKCVDDHGGILDYSSSPNGSTFYMVMPLYESKEEYDHDNPMDR